MASPPAENESAPVVQRRSHHRSKLVGETALRVLLLAGIVVGAGALAGYALSYPLSRLDLGGPDPVTLDHQSMVGIDPELALVRQDDLPENYTEADPAASEAVALVGAQYCVKSEPPEGQIGDRIARAFVDGQNKTLMLSEVVRFDQPRQAKAYVDQVTRTLEGCGRFYKEQAGEQVQFTVTNPRRNPPLNDYVTRTLAPVKGGLTQIVTYFNVGDLVVAVQYAGPPNPPKSMMDGVEREILYRVAPDYFSRTAAVDGQKATPTEPPTTTTIVDPAAPSPTSSPVPPPTIAPDPTFTSPTTTAKPKSKPKSTTTVAPAPTAAPAPAPAPGGA